MDRSRAVWRGAAGALLLACAAAVAGTGVNIAVDATTAATRGYNQFEGDEAALTDGLYPGNSDGATTFAWPNKGNLTFHFEEPRQVSGLRVYVGENGGGYQATAYLGACLGADGQTDASQAVVVADTVNFDFAENAWAELPFPPETTADFIVLATESGAVFYEVQILSDAAGGPSAVMPATWGAAKLRVR